MACSSRQNTRLLRGQMQVRVLPCQPNSRGISSFGRTSPLHGEERGSSPRSSTKQRDGSLKDRVQLCGSWGQRFKSSQPLQPYWRSSNGKTRDFDSRDRGSNPRRRSSHAGVAQTAEQLSCKQQVVRSVLTISTKHSGYNSAWQSPRFGTGKSLVQIQLPRPITESIAQQAEHPALTREVARSVLARFTNQLSR